jgi:hypothetical protein
VYNLIYPPTTLVGRGTDLKINYIWRGAGEHKEIQFYSCKATDNQSAVNERRNMLINRS